jgi:chromosome segregation ATPase
MSMKRIALAVTLFMASNGLCQTSAAPKEQETLQSLLAEVHQLRMSIEAMTVASQRAQIALSAVQIQDAAVARALQRLDNVRNRCKEPEERKQHMAAEIQHLESILSAGATTAIEVKSSQERESQLKSEIDGVAAEASTCQLTEAEASNQLRNEQAKLADAQDRIDRLDKTLEKLSTAEK